MLVSIDFSLFQTSTTMDVSKVLFPAIESGSHKDVINALKMLENHSVHISETIKFNLLEKAVSCGSLLITNTLLAKFPNTDLAPDIKKPLLHTAVENGNMLVVEILLKHGAKINEIFGKFKPKYGKFRTRHHGPGGTNNNALHVAVKNSRLDILKMFLSIGADVGKKGNQGKTALHFAAAQKNVNAIKILLAHGAVDINAEDNLKQTPIYNAIERKCLESVKLLLDCGGASLELSNKIGNTPLHVAARGSVEIFKLLIEHGCNVNAKNDAGETPLHIAARKSSTITEILLNNGASIEAVDERKRTPLHHASSAGFVKIVKLLLNRGACMNAKDEYGRTTPYFSICNWQEKVFCTFLDNGFNINSILEPRGLLLSTISRCKHHLAKYVALLIHQGVVSNELQVLLEGSFATDETKSFEKYQEEVKKMKSTVLENTSVSVFDLLTRNEITLVKHVRNGNVLRALSMDKELKNKFPIYEPVITRQLNKGLELKRLLGGCHKYSSIIFPQLNFACADTLFNYLSDIDMFQVIQACMPLLRKSSF